MTLRLTLAALLLLATGGCGDQGAAYCGALQDQRAKLSDIVGSGDPDALLTGLPVLRDLAKQAPDDLRDEWQTFLGAVTDLRDALRKAGLEPADVQGGTIPDSVSGDRRTALVAAADAIGSERVLAAAEGIEDQARDVCKVNLG